MKQEEEEAAAAAMLNPDKAPEVKIYAKGICCFVFLQQLKIFVKNLHKVKFICFISSSKSESVVLCTDS